MHADTSSLQIIADAVAGRAGWKKPRPGAAGVFRFHLKGGLVLELFSPENKTGIFRGDLGPLPEDGPEADEMLARMARLAAGRLKRRNILALTSEGGHLELALTFDLDAMAHPFMREELLGLARDFLNDYAWWKRRVSPLAARGTTDVSEAGWIKL